MQLLLYEAYLPELILTPRYFIRYSSLLVLPAALLLPTRYVMIVIKGLTYSYMGIKQITDIILASTAFLSHYGKTLWNSKHIFVSRQTYIWFEVEIQTIVSFFLPAAARLRLA